MVPHPPCALCGAVRAVSSTRGLGAGQRACEQSRLERTLSAITIRRGCAGHGVWHRSIHGHCERQHGTRVVRVICALCMRLSMRSLCVFMFATFSE
jgi:hypothetical protein